MTNMPTYQALAHAFAAEGVDHHFTLMGDGNMHWVTAMKDLKGMNTYHARVRKIDTAESNETQKETFYSVTLESSYKDDDGKWQYTSSLGQGDLLLAAKVLDLAHSRIYELRAADRKAQPEDEAA